MNYDPPGSRGERVPTPPSQRPGMVALADHLMATWGGSNLGIYSNRSIRNGSSTSLHAVSRAFDWGYDDRARGLRGVDWLIDHHDQLGVQAIHDYAMTQGNLGRTWGHGQGWHYGSIGSLGGHWFHVELLIETAEDPNIIHRAAQRPSPKAGHSVLTGFARHKGATYGLYSGGYKVLLPSHDAIETARYLAGLGGIDTHVQEITEDHVMRALGPILEKRPAAVDAWGCKD